MFCHEFFLIPPAKVSFSTLLYHKQITEIGLSIVNILEQIQKIWYFT